VKGKNDKILYFFVEGADDKRFVECFIPKIQGYKAIKCIEYSQGKTAEKILRQIGVLEDKGHDVVLLADADKEEELKTKFKELPEDKIFLVRYEIESWFVAGFNKAFCLNEHIDFIQNTETVTKEVFTNIAKRKYKKEQRNAANYKSKDGDRVHFQLINFLCSQKSKYFFQEEVIKNKRNSSLELFSQHFDLK
jgi:hypothetical protein